MSNELYRIAVCLSGELRTYKAALPNIKYYFDNMLIPAGKKVVIDYFIHTWDTNTWKSHETPGKNPVWEAPDPVEIDINLIRKYLNVIDYKVEAGLTGEKLGLWRALFHSMYYSNYLKRKYELENNIKYDMVFKHRFDIALNPTYKFHMHPIEDYIVYSGSPSGRMPRELNCYNFDDVTFYGTSFTMDMMANISRYLIKNTLSPPIGSGGWQGNISPLYLWGPGCLLYHYMTKIGFSPAKTQIIEYSVIRKPVIELGIHTVSEYDKVQQIHINF
jgi:hypothetical protein